MPNIFGEIEEIEDAIEYARRLQAAYCCYGTIEGDGRQCDCKYREGTLFQASAGPGGEFTGCCEARQLIKFLEKVKRFPC